MSDEERSIEGEVLTESSVTDGWNATVTEHGVERIFFLGYGRGEPSACFCMSRDGSRIEMRVADAEGHAVALPPIPRHLFERLEQDSDVALRARKKKAGVEP